MFDEEHSLTKQDVDAIEQRLRNLSLRVLPQLVERDLPRLLNEVRSLHAILFMNTFTTNLQKGLDANETKTNSDEGPDQEGTGDTQDGSGDRPSSEGTELQQDTGVQDLAGARQSSRVRQGSRAKQKRNRRRRKGHK